MGATVTTGKKSFVIKHGERDVFFLFEQTYEKNCHPHTPSWDCVAIGYYENVMGYVFLAAASCEGGCLQNRSGHYKPENYIAAWKVAIRKSCAMPDLDLAISTDAEGRTSFYSTIPLAFRDKAMAVFAEHGLGEVQQSLSSPGYCTIRLLDAIVPILALFGFRQPGEAKGIAPWRLMRDFNPDVERALVSVGLPGANGKAVENPPANFYRLASEDILSVDGEGFCRSEGWAYRVIGNYIENVARDAELACPDSSKALISHFRATVYAAAPLPKTALITLTHPGDAEFALEANNDLLWQRKNAAHLFELLQKMPGATVKASGHLSLTFGDILLDDVLLGDSASSAIYYLTMDLGAFCSIKLPEITAKNEPIKMQLEISGF